MHRFWVRVKPNVNSKSKWYYGSQNKDRDLTGREIIVFEYKDYIDEDFPDCYRYNDSMFIDKEDCEKINRPI